MPMDDDEDDEDDDDEVGGRAALPQLPVTVWPASVGSRALSVACAGP